MMSFLMINIIFNQAIYAIFVYYNNHYVFSSNDKTGAKQYRAVV